MKKIPNLLSIVRLLGIPIMIVLLIQDHHAYFLTLYMLLGFTDILDGYIARRLNATTKLGHFLDTLADIPFYGTALWCLYYLVPEQLLPSIGLLPMIIVLMGLSLFVGYYYHKRLLYVHTRLFKMASSLLFFCVPLSYTFNMTLPILIALGLYVFALIKLILLYRFTPNI